MLKVSTTTVFKAEVGRTFNKATAAESAALAKDLSEEYARQLRLALVQRQKVASGKTLQSVKDELVLGSSSRLEFRRRVVASRSIIFINDGRKAGGKMPVVLNGATSSGKPRFAPVPELLEWLQQMHIPSKFWWPILWKIKTQGIKPAEVQNLALRRSQPRFFSIIAYRARRIAERLFSG